MLALIAAAATMPISYLLMSCEKPVIQVGEKPAFNIWIVNKGREPMLVVQPNDGSDWHWRTPYTGWATKLVSDTSEWPAKPTKATLPRCGNMNSLTDKELVSLQPGGSVVLDQSWLSQRPEFSTPGKYKVVFYYWHVNSDPAKGLKSPHSDPSVRGRVMASEAYRLRSNEVVITVKPSKAG